MGSRLELVAGPGVRLVSAFLSLVCSHVRIGLRKHLSGVTATELKHRLVVRRIRSDVVEVLPPTNANQNCFHACSVELHPQRVGPRRIGKGLVTLVLVLVCGGGSKMGFGFR